MTTINNTGVMGILINYAPNFGAQSGLSLSGGVGPSQGFGRMI